MPTKEQILWFTGFFDGEGCVQLHRKYRNNGLPCYELMLSVSGTHFISITELKNIWQFGRVDRHHENRVSTRKPAWNWICYGHNALFVLENIYQYSITKRNDILIGITFQKWKTEESDAFGKSRRPEESYTKEEYFKQLLSHSHDNAIDDLNTELDAILESKSSELLTRPTVNKQFKPVEFKELNENNGSIVW